nr:heparinase II/III family protein [Aurantimonas sp. VKM B-3413]
MTALLRFDETLGEPLSHARHSGFHRLAAGGTVVIADTGRPPPAQVSHGAHAGTLAFELSSGPCRIVVNCGRPVGEKPEWRRLSRATAAHSTVTLDDRSSSRFAASKGLDRFLGNPLVPGPTRIDLAEPDVDPQRGGAGFLATHDGYDRDFGLLHGRSMILSKDGWTLEGRDRFSRTRRARHQDHAIAAAARFHLHPGVSVEMHGAGEARLTMRGQVWRFAADQPFTIEDSILFADSGGARRTLQLVVMFDPGLTEEVCWRFERER